MIICEFAVWGWDTYSQPIKQRCRFKCISLRAHALKTATRLRSHEHNVSLSYLRSEDSTQQRKGKEGPHQHPQAPVQSGEVPLMPESGEKRGDTERRASQNTRQWTEHHLYKPRCSRCPASKLRSVMPLIAKWWRRIVVQYTRFQWFRVSLLWIINQRAAGEGRWRFGLRALFRWKKDGSYKRRMTNTDHLRSYGRTMQRESAWHLHHRDGDKKKRLWNWTDCRARWTWCHKEK